MPSRWSDSGPSLPRLPSADHASLLGQSNALLQGSASGAQRGSVDLFGRTANIEALADLGLARLPAAESPLQVGLGLSESVLSCPASGTSGLPVKLSQYSTFMLISSVSGVGVLKHAFASKRSTNCGFESLWEKKSPLSVPDFNSIWVPDRVHSKAWANVCACRGPNCRMTC